MAAAIVKFFIEGICTFLLGIFGIIGNVVSIEVLSVSHLATGQKGQIAWLYKKAAGRKDHSIL